MPARITEIYFPDGLVLVREWTGDTRPAYEWLRRAVGGLLQSVGHYMNDDEVNAFADDEGRLKDLDVNVPGMRAVNWPEPPLGWGVYERTLERAHRKAPKADGPVVVYAGMTEAEFVDAWRRMQRWSPLVGPVLIMRGWTDEDFEELTADSPVLLGEPRA